MTEMQPKSLSADKTDEIAGPAPIPMDELNSRLAELEGFVSDSLRSDEEGEVRITRAKAMVLAGFVLELANPALTEEGSAKKRKNLKDQVRFAAIRFSEFDSEKIADKIRALKETAKDGSPGAIAALRQLHRQPNLPKVLADEATRELAEVTTWQVGLNHSPTTKNQVT